jgi:hypothetical protein
MQMFQVAQALLWRGDDGYESCDCPRQQNRGGSKLGGETTILKEKLYFLRSAMSKLLRRR